MAAVVNDLLLPSGLQVEIIPILGRDRHTLGVMAGLVRLVPAIHVLLT